MASLIKKPGGRWEIQFTDRNRRRQTVRLGRRKARFAETAKLRIEHLLVAQISREPVDGETAKWIAELDEQLTDRLARLGLVRRRESALLAPFLAQYIESRTDVKPNTKKKYKTTETELIARFGASFPLREIRPGDVDDWRRELAETRGENTVRKHMAVAKVFFNGALRKGLVDANPFADQTATSIANPERYHFISREDAEKVLAACPDAEWRLIFALSRYGGLRCPSEHLALTWSCVDWENGRLRVPSPKTEHHAGKAFRLIPIFPELRPYLEDAFELAPKGASHVIRRYRDTNVNLRTQLLRIIDRAGLEPWPKVFQNLRSTRETELAESFPMHVVCAWIGNSKAVATKHYLQVTEAHFEKATQKATQTMLDSDDTERPASRESVALSAFSHIDAPCHTCTNGQVAEAGIEPARGLLPTGF